MDNKKEYYISVGEGGISRSASSSPWEFKIEATDEEITELRCLMDDNYKTEWSNFIRAHIPFREYHHDNENDAYDARVVEIYRAIHRLGDEEARAHIEGMGILD